MEGLATKALEAGADVGILKTQCTPAKLIRIIRHLLEKAQAPGTAPAKESDRKAPAMDDREVVAEKACRDSARIELLRDAPQEIARIRQDCLTFVKMGASAESLGCLNSLYRRVRFLSARAGLSGCTRITWVASALEAVLFEIVFNSARATPSARQTTVQAVDCLARLIQSGDIVSDGPNLKRKVLVVDDDRVCNCAVVMALKRANFDAVSAEDPKEALSLLEAGPFDSVLLDVNMPGLKGFQVCEALRRLPQHKTTPVVFVTISGEFQNRARGILAGGDDLITKPISPIELTLKVTIRLSQSGGPDTAALTVSDAAKEVENLQGDPAARSEDSPVGSESANGVLPAATPAPANQPIEEQFCAQPILALAQWVPAGVNGFDRRELRAPAVSPSPSGMSAVLNRGLCDGHRLDEQAKILREAAEDLHKRLREQESAVGKLRRGKEDLRSASKENLAELARLNERLEKARAENESLARQAATLKEEHEATQVGQARQKDAQNKLQLARQTLEQQVKDQASELAGLRCSLEQELAQRKQAEEQLRRELDDERARLQAQAQELAAERKNRKAKIQELEAAQAVLTQLEDKCTAVERQLSESLAREVERRMAVEGQASELAGLRRSLEQESAQRKEAEQKLRGELDKERTLLQAQAQKLVAKQNKLEAQSQELAAAQATLTQLEEKCAAVEQQLAGVGQTLAKTQAQLAQEAERRAAAEGQASELAQLRRSLEQELAQRKQVEEKLRRELDEERPLLQAQAQKLAPHQA